MQWCFTCLGGGEDRDDGRTLDDGRDRHGGISNLTTVWQLPGMADVAKA